MKQINQYINEDFFRYKNTEAKTLSLIGAEKKYWKAFNSNEKAATRIFMTAMIYLCTNHDAMQDNNKTNLDELINNALKWAKENYKDTYKD